MVELRGFLRRKLEERAERQRAYKTSPEYQERQEFREKLRSEYVAARRSAALREARRAGSRSGGGFYGEGRIAKIRRVGKEAGLSAGGFRQFAGDYSSGINSVLNGPSRSYGPGPRMKSKRKAAPGQTFIVGGQTITVSSPKRKAKRHMRRAYGRTPGALELRV